MNLPTICLVHFTPFYLESDLSETNTFVPIQFVAGIEAGTMGTVVATVGGGGQQSPPATTKQQFKTWSPPLRCSE